MTTQTTTDPVVVFEAAITARAGADVVYGLLARPRSHLEWAGAEAKHKSFKLLSLEAPEGPLEAGGMFTSVGENGNGQFHDRSTVTVAEPGRTFAFATASHLDRKHGKGWDVQFQHTYALEPTPEGTRIHYSCAVRPQNYTPYWLKPGVKRLTRLGCRWLIRDNLANLARMAATP